MFSCLCPGRETPTEFVLGLTKLQFYMHSTSTANSKKRKKVFTNESELQKLNFIVLFDKLLLPGFVLHEASAHVVACSGTSCHEMMLKQLYECYWIQMDTYAFSRLNFEPTCHTSNSSARVPPRSGTTQQGGLKDEKKTQWVFTRCDTRNPPSKWECKLCEASWDWS